MKALARRLLIGMAVLSAVGCGSNQTSSSGKDASADLGKTSDLAPATDLKPAADIATSDLAPATPDASPVDLAKADVTAPVDTAVAPDVPQADVPVTTPDATPVDTTPKVDLAAPVDTVRMDLAGPEASPEVAPLDTGALDTSSLDVGDDTAKPADTADAVVASSCDYPQCLKDLQSGCIPTGSCTMQIDMTSFSSNICFSNGVKSSTKSTIGTTGSVVTWKGSAGICYTVQIDSASTAGADLTWKNPSGTVAATAHEDFAANTIQITCTGQAPVTLPLACDTSGGSSVDAGACPMGSCTF